MLHVQPPLVPQTLWAEKQTSILVRLLFGNTFTHTTSKAATAITSRVMLAQGDLLYGTATMAPAALHARPPLRRAALKPYTALQQQHLQRRVRGRQRSVLPLLLGERAAQGGHLRAARVQRRPVSAPLLRAGDLRGRGLRARRRQRLGLACKQGSGFQGSYRPPLCGGGLRGRGLPAHRRQRAHSHTQGLRVRR